MSWFRWIVSVAMLACSTGAAMAEEEKEEEISIECWEGSYLTGFTGHAGYVIDRMSIVCALTPAIRSENDFCVRV
jgi:hypothetical protein